MEYKILGNTGVKVSELCFGTMSFGGDADEATSAAMFNRCRDAGVNFFDCANVYQKGVSETILGKLMKGERDDLIITTKVYGAMSGDVNAVGNHRRQIMRMVEDSLGRLDTDRIDVYFIHRFDDDTPLEETLRALGDLGEKTAVKRLIDQMELELEDLEADMDIFGSLKITKTESEGRCIFTFTLPAGTFRIFRLT